MSINPQQAEYIASLLFPTTHQNNESQAQNSENINAGPSVSTTLEEFIANLKEEGLEANLKKTLTDKSKRAELFQTLARMAFFKKKPIIDLNDLALIIFKIQLKENKNLCAKLLDDILLPIQRSQLNERLIYVSLDALNAIKNDGSKFNTLARDNDILSILFNHEAKSKFYKESNTKFLKTYINPYLKKLLTLAEKNVKILNSTSEPWSVELCMELAKLLQDYFENLVIKQLDEKAVIALPSFLINNIIYIANALKQKKYLHAEDRDSFFKNNRTILSLSCGGTIFLRYIPKQMQLFHDKIKKTKGHEIANAFANLYFQFLTPLQIWSNDLDIDNRYINPSKLNDARFEFLLPIIKQLAKGTPVDKIKPDIDLRDDSSAQAEIAEKKMAESSNGHDEDQRISNEYPYLLKLYFEKIINLSPIEISSKLPLSGHKKNLDDLNCYYRLVPLLLEKSLLQFNMKDHEANKLNLTSALCSYDTLKVENILKSNPLFLLEASDSNLNEILTSKHMPQVINTIYSQLSWQLNYLRSNNQEEMKEVYLAIKRNFKISLEIGFKNYANILCQLMLEFITQEFLKISKKYIKPIPNQCIALIIQDQNISYQLNDLKDFVLKLKSNHSIHAETIYIFTDESLYFYDINNDMIIKIEFNSQDKSTNLQIKEFQKILKLENTIDITTNISSTIQVIDSTSTLDNCLWSQQELSFSLLKVIAFFTNHKHPYLIAEEERKNVEGDIDKLKHTLLSLTSKTQIHVELLEVLQKAYVENKLRQNPLIKKNNIKKDYLGIFHLVLYHLALQSPSEFSFEISLFKENQSKRYSKEQTTSFEFVKDIHLIKIGQKIQSARAIQMALASKKYDHRINFLYEAFLFNFSFFYFFIQEKIEELSFNSTNITSLKCKEKIKEDLVEIPLVEPFERKELNAFQKKLQGIAEPTFEKQLRFEEMVVIFDKLFPFENSFECDHQKENKAEEDQKKSDDKGKEKENPYHQKVAPEEVSRKIQTSSFKIQPPQTPPPQIPPPCYVPSPSLLKTDEECPLPTKENHGATTQTPNPSIVKTNIRFFSNQGITSTTTSTTTSISNLKPSPKSRVSLYNLSMPTIWPFSQKSENTIPMSSVPAINNSPTDSQLAQVPNVKAGSS